MAYQIPLDVVLPPGSVVVLPDAEGSDCCVGTILKGGEDTGFRRCGHSFHCNGDKIEISQVDPGWSPDPQNPTTAPKITTEYTKVVYSYAGAQEVEYNGSDYLLMSIENILALVPPA